MILQRGIKNCRQNRCYDVIQLLEQERTNAGTLCTSRPDNNWAVPLLVTLLVIEVFGIEGYGLGPFSRKVVKYLLVNTD